jgi:hypothetical protein
MGEVGFLFPYGGEPPRRKGTPYWRRVALRAAAVVAIWAGTYVVTLLAHAVLVT